MASEQMDKAVQFTNAEMKKIRAGKASPSMVESVKVEYYGALTPLSQVAGVTTPDARTILIKPWEKSIISEIEKSIINSDLGFNPMNDGELIRINVPALTEERRIQLMKQVKSCTEQGKVGVRNARKDANDSLKQLKKDGASEDDVKTAEDRVQKLTNDFIVKIDELYAAKEIDVMTV